MTSDPGPYLFLFQLKNYKLNHISYCRCFTSLARLRTHNYYFLFYEQKDSVIDCMEVIKVAYLVAVLSTNKIICY